MNHPPDHSRSQERLRRAWPTWLVLAAIGFGLGLAWWINPSETYMPLCGFHAWTGWHCPGCGSVRATHELLHGRWLSALHYNALWIVAMPLVVFWGIREWQSRAGRPVKEIALLRNGWFWGVVAAVVIAFFLLRNLPYAPFTLLAPPG